MLERDQQGAGVIAARDNKINRSHYARLLGCDQSNLQRFRPVFAEYERNLGVETGPMRHLAKMREWLTEAYGSRKLRVRDGKVDRVEFAAHFGLRGGTFMTRHAAIRKLLEEFDARVIRDGYLPAECQQELDRVAAVLANEPKLNKDRLSINLFEVERLTGIAPHRFAGQRHLAELLASHHEALKAAAERSRIDPLLHGRVFAFSTLLPSWPKDFLEQVGARFKQVANRLSSESTKRVYLQLSRALDWIGTSTNVHCTAVVTEAREHRRILGADHWEEALFAYRNHLVSGIASGEESLSSVDIAVCNLRTGLEFLHSGRLTPSTSVPLPGVKQWRKHSGHLRSVAEVGATDSNAARQDFVEFAKSTCVQAAQASGLDLGKDNSGFFEMLRSEISEHPELPTAPSAAIRLILERRLTALKDAALKILRNSEKALEYGDELLAEAAIDGAHFEQAYLNSVNRYQKGLLVNSYFPAPEGSDGPPRMSLANLLSLICQRHDGIPPGQTIEERSAYGQFFAKRFLSLGGLRFIDSLLNPSPDAVGAVLTLYLIESGANVTVGRTLERDCIETSDLKNHVRITGHKARAKGKPIIVDLDADSDAVKGMRWLAAKSGRHMAAAQDDADRLFLMRPAGAVQLMTPHWYTDWFKRLVARSPGLEGIPLRPQMLRPSVLLLTALSNDGQLKAGIAIGQHGSSVSQGYQQKWPTRLLYDENVRRFQSAFETLIASGIEDAASKMGISEHEFQARLGNLRETGLGTFCKDQRGRPGEQQGSCSKLDCWNDCPNLLIVAEVEAIAALQLWQASLRDSEPVWQRDRPERWDEVWLPWLCLTNVVEEKMVRGPLIKVWTAAQKQAAEVSSRPGYTKPVPW